MVKGAALKGPYLNLKDVIIFQVFPSNCCVSLWCQQGEGLLIFCAISMKINRVLEFLDPMNQIILQYIGAQDFSCFVLMVTTKPTLSLVAVCEGP